MLHSELTKELLGYKPYTYEPISKVFRMFGYYVLFEESRIRTVSNKKMAIELCTLLNAAYSLGVAETLSYVK